MGFVPDSSTERTWYTKASDANERLTRVRVGRATSPAPPMIMNDAEEYVLGRGLSQAVYFLFAYTTTIELTWRYASGC